MSKYKVWPEDDEGSALTLSALDAREAAGEWARRWDLECSPDERIAADMYQPTVIVETARGARTRWRVTGALHPTYFVKEPDHA